MKEPKQIVVFITASDEQEAQNIAKILLEQRKVACANIIPKVSSTFWWQGVLESENECMIICKTRASLLDGVIDSVKRNHSYDVPEIIALPIIGGNEDYLEWINSETR
ncbi:MAG: divalent-cation tolerance protein CutA [Chloroflexi bacterium]|jgi:periplasmic divalent cation tolerance protein|nr:divalent-cation tolerance protein CutA [Chloroflexota bacterium]MBT7082026.1 divalent-cation tolerance protein CutA [Chloroflexota bacterium]MBT7289697.1 divalent-cation tolerance protein CutA [Chloroflexota bacterium]